MIAQHICAIGPNPIIRILSLAEAYQLPRCLRRRTP